MTGTSCEGAMCSALETRNSRKRVPDGFDVTRLKLRTVHICGNQLHEESGDFKAVARSDAERPDQPKSFLDANAKPKNPKPARSHGDDDARKSKNAARTNTATAKRIVVPISSSRFTAGGKSVRATPLYLSSPETVIHIANIYFRNRAAAVH
jgi:hypothetical protein